jgi:hypothetical protein
MRMIWGGRLTKALGIKRSGRENATSVVEEALCGSFDADVLPEVMGLEAIS